MSTAIVLFRNDLRLDDNPALTYAASQASCVIPLFVYDDHEGKPNSAEAFSKPGAAAKVWLHLSLQSLDRALRRTDSRLIIRRGDQNTIVNKLIEQTKSTLVVWNRQYEPIQKDRDTALKKGLRDAGVQAQSFNAGLLNEPVQVKNKQGQPFKVFTPFYKHCQILPVESPCAAPSHLRPPAVWPETLDVSDLGLRPSIEWDKGIRRQWTPGEAGATQVMTEFADESMAGYQNGRDVPAERGTSRLSPHLHHGEIGVRRVLEQARFTGSGSTPFIRQLYWREFAYHLLFHYPDTIDTPMDKRFTAFPWRDDTQALKRWQRGLTGYPLIDAGMRELWHTGWMHNRVRMNVASFLVKHLLLPWQLGARWFWDTLVDADLANNTLGWQWTAGCGADAAPYFRIFNPTLQGERFDPQGIYVKHWVPELQRLDPKYIHKPWLAPQSALSSAGIVLGEHYPEPMVDHAAARQRALLALQTIRAPR